MVLVSLSKVEVTELDEYVSDVISLEEGISVVSESII
jgi:hypothetical protein